MDFSTGGSVIMDYGLINTQLLSSQDINWWIGVVWITCGLLWCFYQMFGLLFWRHPFTAEHPLLRHWCSDTFLQIWWRTNSSTSCIAWGWAHFQQSFINLVFSSLIQITHLYSISTVYDKAHFAGRELLLHGFSSGCVSGFERHSAWKHRWPGPHHAQIHLPAPLQHLPPNRSCGKTRSLHLSLSTYSARDSFRIFCHIYSIYIYIFFLSLSDRPIDWSLLF